MTINDKYRPSSSETEKLISDALELVALNNEQECGQPDMNGCRLRNIRLLAHVRSTKTDMEVRDRALWSMQNLCDQIPPGNLKNTAAVIIMTAKRS